MIKYRRDWGDLSELDIELTCFRHGLTVEQGGLGKEQHFKNAVALLIPPGSKREFIWHPWADKMLTELCRHQTLGITGCASSSKTETNALWALVNWLCDPLNTKVLVTSTSLKESRQRIWGVIEDYWTQMKAANPMLPGKLVSSLGMIRYQYGGEKASDLYGIQLIAGDRKKERESISKLIGIKCARVFLIGDELPELSPALIEACWNLRSNPYFQFVGLGNALSIYDPHGQLCTPKDGWGSINEDSEEWETTLGYAIRFDAYKSPAILSDEWRVKCPWMINATKLADYKTKLGETTPQFWRMVRGWWCPGASEDGVYTEKEFLASEAIALQTSVLWEGEPVRLAGCDPSASNDGDNAELVFFQYGTEKGTDRKVLLVTEIVTLLEDTKDAEAYCFQIARRIKQECSKRGVSSRMLAIDATRPEFADILSEILDREFLRITFSGSASEIVTGQADRRKGCERYANRSSELWLTGRDYLRSKQIRGIRPELARQMTARRWWAIQKGGEILEMVEPKRQFKLRVGYSPDKADAFFVGLELARQRLGFRANLVKPAKAQQTKVWDRLVKQNEQTNRLTPWYQRIKAPQIDGGWGTARLR